VCPGSLFKSGMESHGVFINYELDDYLTDHGPICRTEGVHCRGEDYEFTTSGAFAQAPAWCQYVAFALLALPDRSTRCRLSVLTQYCSTWAHHSTAWHQLLHHTDGRATQLQMGIMLCRLCVQVLAPAGDADVLARHAGAVGGHAGDSR
jgi:hypothetical protein